MDGGGVDDEGVDVADSLRSYHGGRLVVSGLDCRKSCVQCQWTLLCLQLLMWSMAMDWLRNRAEKRWANS